MYPTAEAKTEQRTFELRPSRRNLSYRPSLVGLLDRLTVDYVRRIEIGPPVVSLSVAEHVILRVDVVRFRMQPSGTRPLNLNDSDSPCTEHLLFENPNTH